MPQLIHRNLVRLPSDPRVRNVFYTYRRPANGVNPWNGEIIMSRTIFPQEGLEINFVGPERNESYRNFSLTKKLDEFYITVESIARKIVRGTNLQTAIIEQIRDDIYNPLTRGVLDFRVQLLIHLVKKNRIPSNTVIYWPKRVDDFLNDWHFLEPYDFRHY